MEHRIENKLDSGWFLRQLKDTAIRRKAREYEDEIVALLTKGKEGKLKQLIARELYDLET